MYFFFFFRLHVLKLKNLSHTNPLLPADLDSSDTVSAATHNMRETRRLLWQVLQEAFMGDALAAELVICHLVSSVYLRQVKLCRLLFLVIYILFSCGMTRVTGYNIVRNDVLTNES